MRDFDPMIRASPRLGLWRYALLISRGVELKRRIRATQPETSAISTSMLSIRTKPSLPPKILFSAITASGMSNCAMVSEHIMRGLSDPLSCVVTGP
ncbi:MAG: hypothetical protein AAFR17_19285 [Pseudomonadota bacterium]